MSANILAREPIRGGTLTAVPFYSLKHQNNFNPYDLSSGAHYSRDFIYEPLWVFNPLTPQNGFPRLATEYSWSDNAKELTFKLRQNVTFSDGEVFNADDVVFTANLLKKHPDLSQSISWYDLNGGSGNLLEVIKISDFEVKFLFNKVDHLAHELVGKMYIVPEHIWFKVIHPSQFSNRNPVGTGPFTDIRVFEKEVIKLCRNPSYWDKGKPYIDCMQFPQVKSHEQAIIKAANGEIDWMNAVIANIQKNFSAKNKNNHFWFFPSGETSIVLNTKIHPFDNFEFRKAMSLAIDRDYLLQVSQLSISSNEAYETVQPIFSNWRENAQLGEYKYLMQYNALQSKKTLKKAGFIDRDGDGFRENPDGSRLVFHIAISSDRTDLVNVLIAIQEDMQDIGINMRIKSAVRTKWNSMVNQGNYPAYINGFVNGSLDIAKVESYIEYQTQKKTQTKSSVVAQDSAKTLNTLIKQYQLSDASNQSGIISQIQSLMATELTSIELFSNARSYQYNDFYFQGWANQNNPFVRPSVQMGYPERAIHVLNLSLKSRLRYLIER